MFRFPESPLHNRQQSRVCLIGAFTPHGTHALTLSCPHTCFYSAWYSSCPHSYSCPHALTRTHGSHALTRAFIRMVFMPSHVLMPSCPHTYSCPHALTRAFTPHGTHALKHTHARVPCRSLMLCTWLHRSSTASSGGADIDVEADAQVHEE